MRLCIVIHHLSPCLACPRSLIPTSRGNTEHLGHEVYMQWGSTLCSFSVLCVQNDAASSNPETQTRCLVGGRSQSMSSPCRLRSVSFNSICFFGSRLSCCQLLLFLPNLLSIYTLHLSHYISSNQAKLPLPKLESWLKMQLPLGDGIP